MRATSRDFRRLSTVTLLLTLLALVALLARADHAGAAATFNPEGAACLDNEATVDPAPLIPGNAGECDGDSAAGAVSGVTTSFNLPEGDVNFAATVNFLPPQWGVTAGDQIQDGAIVGQLDAQATLGLIGGSCSSTLFPLFVLVDATVDTTGTQTTFDEQFVIQGNGLPRGVTQYPDYVNRVLSNVQPRARLYGQTTVSGVKVSLNFVILEPGTTIVTPTRSLTTDPALGYPSVTILQDAGDPDNDPEPNAITDFCSLLNVSTITYGKTQDFPSLGGGGVNFRTNPSAAGKYNAVNFAAAQRDADNDGKENSLDPCPLNADTWDARVGSFGAPQAGDSDGDRIPDVCDESPNDASAVIDIDSDGYQNTGDNCPQEKNGVPQTNQSDDDNDGIGDICDPHPTDPDTEGALKVLCVVSPIQVGTGGAAAPAADQYLCTDTIAALDLNRNGVPDFQEGGGADDADGDGVPDTSDDCASTPSGATVDANGCAQSQLDDDEDGVFNDKDRCPGTAAGAAVDQFGCTPEQAVADDDGDGVKNVDDKCPNTPSGESVDAEGCSASQLATGDSSSGPSTGVGSLAPVAASIPAWAAAASAFGSAGLLGSLGAFASRRIRRRRL